MPYPCHVRPSQANAFAKGVLYDVLEYIHGKWPGAGPFSYVDDLAQTARGYESGVLRELGLAGVCMAKELEKASCVISAKSVLVASNTRLGKRLMEVFSNNGIVMHQERAPDTLGWLTQRVKGGRYGWYDNALVRHAPEIREPSILFAAISEHQSCIALELIQLLLMGARRLGLL